LWHSIVVRSRALAAFAVALLVPSACVLDWGSLRPVDDASADAADEPLKEAPIETGADGSSRDATSDAKADAAADADAATDDATADTTTDATTDDATGDATGDAGADALADATPDATTDVSVDATADAGADASDAADAADASSCPYAFNGTLATYDFTGEPGNQASTAPSAVVSGLTAGSISRSSALVAVSGANSINSSGWSTGALDSTRYYTLTLTPPAGCVLDVASISLDTKTSGTGPASGDVATSADGFASDSAFTPNAVTSVTLSVSGATSAIEIRIYGYAATSAQGTMRIQNTMSVSGSLQ
jgi:hypothetical protein